MKFTCRAFFSTLFFLFGLSTLKAEDCSKALILDQVDLQHNVYVTLSYMQLITKDNYSEKRKSLGTGAKLIVEGIPMSGFVDFDSFSSAREKLFEQYEFNSTRSESISYLSQTLSNNAVQAYRACLQTQSVRNPGFHGYVSHIDKDVVIVTLFWNAQLVDGIVPKANINVVFVKGSTTNGTIVPKEIPLNHNRSFAFERKTMGGFSLIIEGGGKPPFKIIVAKQPTIRVFCEDKYPNDTVLLKEFTGTLKKVCNKCGDCQDTIAHVFSDRKVDLACIRDVSGSGKELIHGYDCGWNPYGGEVQNLSYGRKFQKLEIKEGCAFIKAKAKAKGVNLPKGVCSE